MARPLDEYRIRLASEGEEEYLYLNRLHQECFMSVLPRHTACFSPSPSVLEYMACHAARDLTGNIKLITEEYLRGIFRARATGTEGATRPYIYIPPKEGLFSPNSHYFTEVVCAGIFSLSPVARSVVLVVWYQEKFALPIDESVIEQLRLMDYDRFNRYWYDDYLPGRDG